MRMYAEYWNENRIEKYVFDAAFYRICQSSIARLNVSRAPAEHDPAGWSTQHAYFSRDNRRAVERGRRIIALSSLIESQNPSGSATRPREVPSNAPCGHFPQGTW